MKGDYVNLYKNGVDMVGGQVSTSTDWKRKSLPSWKLICKSIEQSNTIDKGVHNLKEKKFDFIQIDFFKA